MRGQLVQGRPELSPRAGSLNPGERSINSGCQFGFNMRITDLSSSDREKLRRHKGRGRASSCPEPHPRCAAVRVWLAGQRRPPRLFPANSGLTLVPPPSLLSHRPASDRVPRPAPVPRPQTPVVTSVSPRPPRRAEGASVWLRRHVFVSDHSCSSVHLRSSANAGSQVRSSGSDAHCQLVLHSGGHTYRPTCSREHLSAFPVCLHDSGEMACRCRLHPYFYLLSVIIKKFRFVYVNNSPDSPETSVLPSDLQSRTVLVCQGQGGGRFPAGVSGPKPCLKGRPG